MRDSIGLEELQQQEAVASCDPGSIRREGMEEPGGREAWERTTDGSPTTVSCQEEKRSISCSLCVMSCQ